MTKNNRLGDAELEVMQVLWAMPEGGSSTAVLEKMTRPWALATLMTVLGRLAEKGYVRCDRTGRSNHYTALVRREDYQAGASRAFLEKVFGNSFSGLVASLYDSKSIDKQDIDQLRQFLDELEGKQK